MKFMKIKIAVSAVFIALTIFNASGKPGKKDQKKKIDPLKERPGAVLFLSSASNRLDPVYIKKLQAKGWSCTSTNLHNEIPAEFFKKFNLFVIDETFAAGQEEAPGMDNYHNNMKRIIDCVRNGAGLLFYAQGNEKRRVTWNREMKSLGIQVGGCAILDPSLSFKPWQVYVTNHHCWTENLNQDHPVTNGLKRIYYPTGELNATGVYCSMPLYCDENWTPLVKSMKGAFLGTLHFPRKGMYYETDKPDEYVMVATRQLGKGRIGAITIAPQFTHRGGYRGGSCYELRVPKNDGLILEKGDGNVPSDTLKMLNNMFTWLAAESYANGFGGYKTGETVPAVPPPAEIFKEEKNTSVYKALIGAHSRYSGGKGSVADYAEAAKKAGYSLLVFTEDFSQLSKKDWEFLVADCKVATDKNFICLPGYEIEDVEGSRFIYIAPSRYPHPAWLTKDRKLINAYTVNFYVTNHLVVAHRPESTPIPPERLKHFQGISVYTYRDGKLIDNSLNTYIWQVKSASFPIPIVVHEIFGPDEVERAAKTGFQQYTPAGRDLEHAVHRFCRAGLNTFRFPMISEGPKVSFKLVGDYDPRIQGKNPGIPKSQQSFSIKVTASSDVPLKTITLYDGYEPLRRWFPKEKSFEGIAELPFSHEYTLHVIAEDQRGRKALRCDFWISPGGLKPKCGRFPGYFRCTDRQNWLGIIPMYYTGSFLPFGHAFNSMVMPIKGTREAEGLFNSCLPGACMAIKMNFPFFSNQVALTEYVLDEKYVNATFKETGLAALPSRASKVSSIYSAVVRYYNFNQTRKDEPCVSIAEYDIVLKRAVEPKDPKGLFPGLDVVKSYKYCWSNGKGGFVKGDIPKRGKFDLKIPAGGLAGSFIPLEKGFAIQNGKFGHLLEGAPDYLPARTRLSGRFLVADGPTQVNKPKNKFDSKPEVWLKAMGFAGETPYKLTFAKGKPGKTAFTIPVETAGYGVVGNVEKTAVIPYDVPLQISPVNPHWTAGLWRDGEPIEYCGVFEKKSWPLIDVSKKGNFYAGNLITADHPRLVLSLGEWSKDKIKIDVHNPTSDPITATIKTAGEIKNHKQLNRKLTVPSGASIIIEE